jgi:hypothetical protein
MAAPKHNSMPTRLTAFTALSDWCVFARVLGEPVESFRYCHTSQFSTAVGRYFGDFAVCPQCLGEGFHSVLFSFKALRECPVHRTEFW